MKLFLTSLIPSDLTPFLKLFGKNKSPHIALIPTAYNPTGDTSHIAERTAQLKTAGFRVTIHNLEDYKPGDFADYDGCWVMGGNTFYLNYWLAQSGADDALPELLKQGFVYGGESAGAVVVGETLHGVELCDDPNEAPEVLWEGLGLVNYGILPHWGDPKFAPRLEQAYDEMRLFGPVKTLKNDDYIVIS